jgi:hypothetical protein
MLRHAWHMPGGHVLYSWPAAAMAILIGVPDDRLLWPAACLAQQRAHVTVQGLLKLIISQ